MAPRFEDAFVAALGGARKGKSTLAGKVTVPPTAALVVEAKGLTKTFGTFTAVNHIDFAIHQGEIFGLLGANGAGKSTTFKMLCGLLRPTSGTALVAGYDLYREAAAARAQLGYMAQKFRSMAISASRRILNFFAGAYGLNGGHAARGHRTHDRGVRSRNPYLATNSGTLPLGYKQRLALACAVMHGPRVLFLDEPTSGIDPLTRREFWAHINAMVAHGVDLLVTTHFMDEAEYCDRIALIDAGIAGQFLDQLRDYGLKKPWYWDEFMAGLDTWHHLAAPWRLVLAQERVVEPAGRSIP